MAKEVAQRESLEQVVNEARILAHELPDDAVFPNSRLPLLVYRGAVALHRGEPAAIFEQLFAAHGWPLQLA